MGTKVIDKLRIQGKSAPRVVLDSSPSRRPLGSVGQVVDGSPIAYGSPLVHGETAAAKGGSKSRASRPTLVLIPEPGQEVKSKIGRSLASSIPSSSSSSAASRRLEFLQRVQQANRGLSAADAEIQHANPSYNSRQHYSDSINSVAKVNCAYTTHCNTTLPNIQFLLRGKPVQHEELEVGSYKVSSAPTPSVKSDFHNNTNHSSSNNVQAYVPHQRVGHYKTSAKEVYRARHKHDIIQNFLVDPRHASSAYRAIRSSDVDVTSNANTVLGNNAVAANGPAYFYLGPPMAGSKQAKSSNGILNRPRLYIPTASTQIPSGDVGPHGQGEGQVTQARGSRYTDNISLTGQQLTTPRLIQTNLGEEGDLLDHPRYLDGIGDYPDAIGRQVPAFIPDIYSRPGGSPPLISGSRSRKHGAALSVRCGSRESSGAPPVPPSSSVTGADLELLQQCLHVNQSHAVASPAENGTGAGTSSSESVRLKHFTQYVKKDDGGSSLCNSSVNKAGKVNYNNPYRNHRGSEKKAVLSTSKSNRYVFNSVNSYIHFNKIYPRLDGNANEARTATNGGGDTTRPRIPQVNGFSPHCTETVMLKMMFGMNKPAASVKSGARYSDIAVHADLDEFVVVGSTTTSASRSTSVASRKLYHGTTPTANNFNLDNSNDSGMGNNSNKRMSNSTLRRSKSNMSSSNEISVDLREREGEEDEEENDADGDLSWRIPEVEDDQAKTPQIAANVEYVDDTAENETEDNEDDANITVTALEESEENEMGEKVHADSHSQHGEEEKGGVPAESPLDDETKSV